MPDRELSLRAADLASYLARQPDGTPRLDLPDSLRQASGAAPASDIFAILGSAVVTRRFTVREFWAIPRASSVALARPSPGGTT